MAQAQMTISWDDLMEGVDDVPQTAALNRIIALGRKHSPRRGDCAWTLLGARLASFLCHYVPIKYRSVQ